ncbi:MAG: DUF481 domain-containing protein [Ghiorsea sp.]|nr:DUF481 domain-containing protein [Ghiorsea sp.]
MLKHGWVGACCSVLLLAQVGYAEEPAQPAFSGSVDFGGNFTSGNTNTDSFNGNLDLGYTYQKWASTFSFKGSQTKEKGVLTSDYYEAYLRGSYDVIYHMYGVIQLGYRQDVFGGIYSEKSYVAALGYHAFTDIPDFLVDIELGYGQRITDKVNKLKVDHDNGKHAAMMAEYVFDGDNKINVKISGEFGNDDDFLLREITWVHQLFNGFIVNFSHEERTITVPAAGIVPTDTKTSILLGYSF